MFLQSKYILANELVNKMNIHIANISMLAKEFEDSDCGTFVKKNNCTFINTKSRHLPHNILVGTIANEFTDMSNKLPCTYVREEYPMTEKEMFKSGIVTDKIKVAGKQFYVFSDDFVKTMKNKIGYVLDASETEYCTANGQILGSIQLSKNKFFTWY